MDASTILSRLQFAFTISFHYLFPQLTMGLALLIVILKTLYLLRKDERWFVHANLRKGADGAMEHLTRPVAPYVVPMTDDELSAYHKLRIPAAQA